MKQIPIEYQVSPYMVFLIITIQMGVGMLGFERISAKLVEMMRGLARCFWNIC